VLLRVQDHLVTKKSGGGSIMKKTFILLLFAFFTFAFISPVKAAFGENITVNFLTSFDDSNKELEDSTDTLNIGDVISLDSSDYSSYTFAFWVINGVVREDMNATSSIVVQSSMTIHAVFYDTGEHAVLFEDSNGQLISIDYVLDSATVSSPSYAGFTKPGMTVDTGQPWKTDSGTTALSNIDSSRVYVLQYSTDTSEVVITITGGTESSITANRNDLITVVASDLENFKHWEDVNGTILSYQSTYVFTAANSKTMIASSTGSTAPTGYVGMTDDLAVRDNYETYIGHFEIASGTFVECGYLLSTTEVALLTVDTAGVTVAKSNNYNPITNEFVMSFPEVTYATIRAYIAVDNGSTIDFYYSDIQFTPTSDLFISEYIEGSGTIRALEVYNGTSANVDLSEYRLVNYYNGNSTVSDSYIVDLTGTLSSNQVMVIYYTTGATQALIDQANTAEITIPTSSSMMNFNGDDAISLEKSIESVWEKVDVIGQIGVDPGSFWGIEPDLATRDMTLIRNSDISSGDQTGTDAFDPTIEWTGYSQDTFTYLGTHTYDGLLVSDKASVVIDANNITVPSEVKIAGDMNLATSGVYGSTISWSSDDTDVISNDGIVVLPTPSPQTVTLTATVTKGSVSKEMTYEVAAGLTDTDRVVADKADLSIGTDVYETGDMNLTTSGTNGSTITWSSDTPTTISNAGVVLLLPESGSVEVTMTATITYGTASDTKDFIVTVYAEATVLSDYTFTVIVGSTSGETENFTDYLTGPTTTSYISVSDVSDSYGVWTGIASKDSKGFGQKAGNYLTYTAEAGYYIYSIQIEGNTNSTVTKTISFGGTVILTNNNSTYVVGGTVILPGYITTGAFSTAESGTRYLAKIVIVCKPLE